MARAETVTALRQQLDTLVEAAPAGTPPALAEALRGLMAAVDYKDSALIQSHLGAMIEAVAATADAEIERLLRRATRTQELCEKVRSLDATPGPEFDRLGRGVEQLIDRELAAIAGLRSTWIDLATKHGADVRNAVALEAVERQLTGLKAGTLGTWPWSTRGLPPVDRGMVQRSREARARGEGLSVEDAIRQAAGR